MLTCKASNVTEDIVRWFVSTNTSTFEENLAGTSVDIGSIPQRLPLLVDWQGLQLYVDDFVIWNNYYSYNSTLYINTSTYNSSTTRYFSCGTIISERSEWIGLSYTFSGKCNITFKLCKYIL